MLPTVSWWLPAAAETIQVGPQRTIKTIAAAAAVAHSGSVVEVDAGTYAADVAVWTQDSLSIRAVGGRVHLVADGAAAEGKAIWVIRGGQIEIDGFEFTGARVKSRNGAGIRLEAGKLVVRNCSFLRNENGILTSNDLRVELHVANSEFGHNGHGDGLSHNLYAGSIARLTVNGSYFHHANGGHLLKSRAAINDIRYNRLVDGDGGRASYELEFANGGVAYVVGNVIEQGTQTENPHLISYGIEGYRWIRNALYLVNNTLVDGLAQGGVMIRVAPGNTQVTVVNNLLVGSSNLDNPAAGDYRNNALVDRTLFETSSPAQYRVHSRSGSSGEMVEIAPDGSVRVQLEAQYVHPMRTQPFNGKPHNLGAVQNSHVLDYR